MHIGGLLKFSLIDFPGKMAAVIFTQGCNYRCPFCHNPELVLPELFQAPLAEDDVLEFLERRKDQLQGVVVTGGEPTLHNDLPSFLKKIKSFGYLIKLDTNGSRPDVLRDIVEAGLVDFLAMDIKSSEEGYCQATGISPDITAVKESIRIIKGSGLAYQFRTTVLRKQVSPEDLKAIQELIGGDTVYRIQKGNLKGKILDFGFLADDPDYTSEEFDRLREAYSRTGQVVGE